MATKQTITRSVTFGVRPLKRSTALRMHGQIDACRFVWNRVLADCRDEYADWCGGVGRETARAFGPAPSRTFFSLGLRLKRLRAEHEWLKQHNFTVTRAVLKRQAESWRRFLSGNGGHPRFQPWHRDGQSFTIPENVRVEGGRLRIPSIGWVELRDWRGRPHIDGKPLVAHVKCELGRWYASIAFEVADARTDNGHAIGVDLNTAHAAVALSTYDHLPYPAHLTEQHEARVRRHSRRTSRRKWWLRSDNLAEPRLYNTRTAAVHAARDLGLTADRFSIEPSNRRTKARLMKARAERKVRRIRHDWQHQVTTAICRSAGLVVVEDLRIKNLTAAGKTASGKRKRGRKRGLNREFLRVGPAQIRAMLEYKASECRSVNPAYTSQTCSRCGVIDSASRAGVAFSCVACGFSTYADTNAALNILASGTGATGRRGALALATPVTRQYRLRAGICA